MARDLLTDSAIRTNKPGDKDKRLSDGHGLYLLIKPTGSKWWRFDYSIDDTRKTLSLGTYPTVSLADARRRAHEARKLVANGIDPSTDRKVTKLARRTAKVNAKRIDAGLPAIGSFEEIARQWLESTRHTVKPITHQKKIDRLELHVFPTMGRMDIAAIKAPDIFNLVKPLFRKLETAHRVYAEISSVFNYAIAHGLTDFDPSQAVRQQIPAKKVKHRPALIDPNEVGRLMRDIQHYQGTFVVQCALKLSPLLFQRPGEIRQMEWKDIDLIAKEWRYLVTKTNTEHIVPLSTQAISVLNEIKPLTGSSRFVFPSARADYRPMSENTIRTALLTLGYDSDTMTPHGFRTTASTLLNEQGWRPDAIERQLCHMPKDQVRAAYNRAQYLDERRKMMQSWSDYLYSLMNT